jgi:hypothetical protein
VSLPRPLPRLARCCHLRVVIAALGFVLLAAIATTTSATAAPGAAPAGVVRGFATDRLAVAAATGSALPSVRSLTVTGTRTSVTVARVYRTGQVRWISHVLDDSLTDLNGCQAVRIGPSWQRSSYRAAIDSVCDGGSATVRAALVPLERSRPWYRITVSDVPLVGFTLLADLPGGGNGDAVPAALAKLPTGEFTFTEGDDVSLSYVGPGVTQTQLRAAVTAFAGALRISPSSVTVGPVFG